MNKKVIKAMYSYAVGKDDIRPLMQGIHFSEEECVATDTHVLVVYKETKPELVGKTILITGEPAANGKGKYPDYKRVLPKKSGNPVNVNWKQVYNALKWYKKQPDFNEKDRVCIGGCHLSMVYLLNVLEVYNAAGDLFYIKASTSEPARPILLESEQLTSIIMPCTPEEDKIDLQRLECESVVMSYENFILTYATESTKPKEKVEEMAWL